MILGAPHLLLSLRWVPPAVSILGSSPIILAQWTTIKILTFPFPRCLCRAMDSNLNSSYQKMVAFYYETWSGVEFCYYGDQIPDTPENVLYLSNHQCTVDWVLPEILCLKQGGYGGRVRYILKDALKFLPLYGWYLGQHGGIYVKRNRNGDHKTMIKGLRRFVDEDIPVWLVIFPEGTRYSSSRVKGSKDYARSIGLPEMNHVLTPKTTGFELAMEHAGEHFDAVYDVTVFYQGMQDVSGRCGRATPPHLFNIFCGVTSKIHIHVKRTAIEDIPKDLEGRRKWIYESYQRKDKIMKDFLLSGRCDAPRVSRPLYLSQSLLPTLLYSTATMLALATPVGRKACLSIICIFTAVTFISGFLS